MIVASGFSRKNETYHVVIFNLWVRASVDTIYCRDRTTQISHSLTRSRQCEDLSFAKKHALPKVRWDQSPH